VLCITAKLTRQCPVWVAGSIDRRNTFCELLSGGLIEKGLSRPFIELPCDRAELALAMQGQIGAPAGLPYFNPHSFRNTLVALGEKICPNPEAFKAWSQNLGHAHVLTTFTSYGAVASSRQAEILEGLRSKTGALGSEPDQETVQQVVNQEESS
jgi:hypothetical protein